MNFRICKHSGSRLVGAITFLGHLGPKHHGLIIGEYNGKLYVAEQMTSGYQYATIDDFVKRYKLNGVIKQFQNDGNLSRYEVVRRSVEEINAGGNGKYNLVSNNCESFVNRAIHGTSVSSQVANTLKIAGLFVLAGFVFHKVSKAA